MSCCNFYFMHHPCQGLLSLSFVLFSLAAPIAARANPTVVEPSEAEKLLPLAAPGLESPIEVAQAAYENPKPKSAQQRFEISPNVSTLGLGASVAFPVANQLKLRAGFNTFSKGIDFSANDIDYDGDLKLLNVSGGLEYYPSPKSGFFVTAGAAYQNNRVEGVGRPSDLTRTYTINGRQYSAALVGELDAEIRLPNKIAPYLGIGYSSPIDSDRNLSLFANLGVMFTGKAELDITSPNPIANDPRFAADLQREVDKARDDLKIPSVYPIFSLGLTYRF
jgi:hypothetical protein